MKWSERAAALAIALAACPAAAAAAQSRPPAVERPLPITPVGLVGRWTDSGDCAKFVIFRSDGTFLARDGGQGTWRLARGRLTLAGRGGTVILTVRSLTARQMVVVNADGSTGTSRRC